MSYDVRLRERWIPLPNWFRSLVASKSGSVLLETAKFDEENFRSILFIEPLREIIANTVGDIDVVFQAIDELVGLGYHIAGYISYECGYTLQNLLPDRLPDEPLIRMGVFRAPIVFNHRTGIVESYTKATHVEGEGRVTIRESALEIPAADYAKQIDQIQKYLEAGHSYQVNFTDRVSGKFVGSPAALYQHLVDRQPVAYGAYMDCGDYQILSLSPELFYRATVDRIVVKPMKGTWPRGVNAKEDVRAAESLRQDAKNCAEHVTIVDLLRNDLGKVSVLGSVKVDRLMEVERYSTLHQMTSTISGTPAAEATPADIFRALFPSGSITGAPKRRTMEIIRELERCPRSVYTGAIGSFGPGGEACFNVAIRTLITKQDRFWLGVGGGITLDSDPETEYAECQLKASFLHARRVDFELIETMRVCGGIIPLLELHILRLKQSAAYFQIEFDEPSLRCLLAETLKERHASDERLRLTLDRNGRMDVCCSEINSVSWAGKILLSAARTASTDPFLYHKTSNRSFYEAALAEAQRDGFDEVLFLNEYGCVTEGAISNVFAHIGTSIITPDVSCGLLPGVQRTHMLSTNPAARTSTITMPELLRADQIWFCNALRGSRRIVSICDKQGNLLWHSDEHLPLWW